jgi:hypothetical protein
VASVVAEARSALGHDPSDAHEGAVRLWAAVHGPVTLELEGIPPFSHDGERLARLAVTDVLVGLRLMPISPPTPPENHP